MGYSPRLNSDADHIDLMSMWNEELPTRSRCRARMMWIGQTEINHMLENGKFADTERISAIMGPQQCPEGGTYSVIIGQPIHAFTVHCSVQKHDAGMVEPRGYSPGRNRE
jgi:hypothetical protein